MSPFYGVWLIFGIALHNERNPFCGNSNMDNTCLDNQWRVLVVVNVHFTHEGIRKFTWSASIFGRTHILGEQNMYWCHVGVYMDNFFVFELLFQLTTHSKSNTSVSPTVIPTSSTITSVARVINPSTSLINIWWWYYNC